MKGLNISSFKKVACDEHSTTLMHPKDGHTIKVIHAKLSDKMRKDLDNLPMHAKQMAVGGMAEDPNLPIAPVPQAEKPLAEDVISAGINAGLGSRDMIMREPDLYAKAEEVRVQNEELARVRAQQEQAQMQADKQAAEAKAYNDIIQRNEYRTSHGLSPLPVPNQPAPVQMPIAQEVPVPSQMPVSAPQAPAMMQDPFGTQAYLDNYSKGIAEQKAGLTREAIALGAQGKRDAEIEARNIEHAQTQQALYQTNYDELEKERQSFQKDLQNKHIDSKHYFNSLGTSQKIATAVGLILGGIGSGLTHQPNAALNFLQSQISNDIDAQKANLGKAENLLSANMRQFGNLRDATDMTRVMQNDIVSAQLKQSAAQAMDPVAKARALKAAGEIDTQSAPILSQLAVRRSMLKGMQGGHVDPAIAIRMIVPEKDQHEAFKELQTAQNMTKARDNLLIAFEQLDKLNTVGNRVTHLGFEPASVGAIRDPLLAQLSKESAGRFTEADSLFLKKLFPAPGDAPETVATKRNQMVKFVSEKMNFPMLQAYGLNASVPGRFDQHGQSKIKEAPPKIK